MQKEKKEKKSKKKKDKKEKKEKKKAKSDKAEERRPFDRDLDLRANVFDEAQRKLMIRKSQQLTNRFGHGSSQFL